jgi:hypothetical protein
MRHAYLLAMIDVRRTPPAVVSVGIFSDHERGITIDHSKYAVTRIADACRHTYDEARAELEQHIKRTASLSWVVPLMLKRGAF